MGFFFFFSGVALIALSRMKTPPTIIILRLMCALSFLSLELNFSTHTFARSLTRSFIRATCICFNLFSHKFNSFIYLFLRSLNSYHILFFWGLQLLPIFFRSFCDSSFLLFAGGGDGGDVVGVVGGQSVIYSVNRKRLFATASAIK